MASLLLRGCAKRPSTTVPKSMQVNSSRTLLTLNTQAQRLATHAPFPSVPSASGNSTQTRTYYEISPEPFHLIPGRKPNNVTADEAVQCIKANDRVFIHGASTTPQPLVKAMVRRGRADKTMHNVQLISIHTSGDAEYCSEDLRDVFRPNVTFFGGNLRTAVNSGRADFTPIFLRDIPRLFRNRLLPVDVALVSVSPPDSHGYCTLGPSVDITRAALQSARVIVAFINKQMPRTFGDGIIHQSHFNYVVEGDEPLAYREPEAPSPADEKIAQQIAEQLVADGSTLQVGIGRIPNTVLSKLTHHRDLGIHTEMCSDGVMNLVELGVLTNAKKQIAPGKTVTSFASGTRKFFDWMHNNPAIAFLDTAYVNNPAIIARNPNVVAINSCIEIDIAGQVVSSTIGRQQYSGVGGQLDFVLGSTMGKNGKAIITLPSVTRSGKSRIVPVIQEGAAVTTSREHVQYVVTEFGVANLFGKTLIQRARELIRVAHPDHREALEKEMRLRYGRV